MVRFGGNQFNSFSVPLVFEDRYFIMEPGNPPELTVFLDVDGAPVFDSQVIGTGRENDVENGGGRRGIDCLEMDEIDYHFIAIGILRACVVIRVQHPRSLVLASAHDVRFAC